MGILSKIFAGSHKSENSHVRIWVDRRLKKLDATACFSLENLFFLMTYALSTFGKQSPHKKTSSNSKGLDLDVSETHLGDASLFELGCYMYFRIDFWLFQHEPSHRDEITMSLSREFISLFTNAFDSTRISAVFEQRVSGFSQVIQAGGDVKECHFHLSKLILQSKDNHMPKDYDFGNSLLIIHGFCEEMSIKTALASWEAAILPEIEDALKNYCNT